MNHMFKRVVVLLNDFENIENVLQKAFDFSTQHETSLEILYVQEEALFDIPDYFLSDAKIENECLDKKKIKAKIQEHLVRLGIQGNHAILVYEDDTVAQVLHYAKNDKNILFVTRYHEELSEKLLEQTAHSFWIVKNMVSNYQNIALPFDFRDKGKETLKLSKHIFANKSITILHDYRYVLDTLTVQVDYLNVTPLVTPEIIELNEKLEKEQKEAFEKYQKEFEVKGEWIEGTGSLERDLMEYISKKDFDLTMMYHQDTELFLSPSLIVELLKGLSMDFFIVNL